MVATGFRDTQAPPPELVGTALTEFTTPFPDGFIRHDHLAGEQEFFDIAVAQVETEVQPDAVASEAECARKQGQCVCRGL
jgi:hypothetical protein